MNAMFTSIICSWAVYSRSGYPAVIAPCVYLISACPPCQLLIKLRWKRMRSGDRHGLQIAGIILESMTYIGME
jgi:hypothetical protein